MKTDKWWGSLLWGRIGGAVMVLSAFVMQGLGIEFGAEDQQAAFGAVESIMAGVGAVMVLVSKARESKKTKADQSGKASVGVMAALAIFGAMALLAAGCATGPSQYAADNPDSYLIRAIDAAGFSPEGTQEMVSAVIQAEIAMGTFTREDVLAYIGALEKGIDQGATYGEMNALLEKYAARYAARSGPATHAAVLAYYLFRPKLQVPDLAAPIIEADRNVLRDLFAAVRADLGEPTSSIDEFRENLRASLSRNRIQFEIDHAAEIADLKTGANRYLDRMTKVRSNLE